MKKTTIRKSSKKKTKINKSAELTPYEYSFLVPVGETIHFTVGIGDKNRIMRGTLIDNTDNSTVRIQMKNGLAIIAGRHSLSPPAGYVRPKTNAPREKLAQR